MPLLKNAKKKLRVDARRAQRNRRSKTLVKNTIKAFRTNPTDKDLLSRVFSMVDRAAKTHILHKRTADRIKSRLTKLSVHSVDA